MNFRTSLSIFLLAVTMAHSAVLVTPEDFDSVASLSAKGWVFRNDSEPVGTTGWFQGNGTIFSAQSGVPDSYVAANFLNSGIGGTIQNWLFSPVFQFENGSQIAFFTRTTSNPAIAPDRLRLWFSDNETSTVTADFTRILSVNEDLTSSGYPGDWSRYVYTFAGLSGIARGRFAFEYSVPDTSVNGDYIGIDSLVVTSNIPEPATFVLLGSGLTLLLARKRRRHPLAAFLGIASLAASAPVFAEGKKTEKPKWESVQVEVVQKDLSERSGGAKAGRIYVAEGAEPAVSNARIAAPAPVSKKDDSTPVKLSGPGGAAKLGSSYLTTLEATKNADSSIEIVHKHPATAKKDTKGARRDQ